MTLTLTQRVRNSICHMQVSLCTYVLGTFEIVISWLSGSNLLDTKLCKILNTWHHSHPDFFEGECLETNVKAWLLSCQTNWHKILSLDFVEFRTLPKSWKVKHKCLVYGSVFNSHSCNNSPWRIPFVDTEISAKTF